MSSAPDSIIKQSFVYKRASRGIIPSWKLKFVVLSSSNPVHDLPVAAEPPRSSSSNSDAYNNTNGNRIQNVVLRVYDQRGQVTPKHEIFIDSSINVIDGFKNSQKIAIGGMIPFIIESGNRKYYFAAQTKTDHDEWISQLSSLTAKSIPYTMQVQSTTPAQDELTPLNLLRRFQTLKPFNPLNHNRIRQQTFNPVPQPSTYPTLPHSSSLSNLQQIPNVNGNNKEWEMRSSSSRASINSVAVFDSNAASFGGTATNNPGVVGNNAAGYGPGYGGTLKTLINPQDLGDDDIMSIVSRVESLSFCSEPVLTPQELSVMGRSGQFISASALNISEAETNRVYNPKRRQSSSTKSSMVDQYISQTQPDYNEKYQQLLTLSNTSTSPEILLRQDIQILDLVGSFKEHAMYHAMKMVDEFHLKSMKKKLNANNGGVQVATPVRVYSGGEFEGIERIKNGYSSVLVNGIVLNFIYNYQADSKLIDIETTMTESSNELLAINVVNQARAGLHTALMVLFDYKGFRIIAYADMPLSEKTIIQNITSEYPKIDDRANPQLSKIAKSINLKPHTVNVTAERRLKIPTAASVEIHHSVPQQRTYVTTLHELFPMDYYSRETNTSGTRNANNSITSFLREPNKTKRLRPEFLQMYGQELVSDAFTEWAGCNHAECENANNQVSMASRFLQENWIPAFVKKLDNLKIRPVDSQSLTMEMHRAGINMRYLGLISKLSQIPYIKEQLHIEIVARAFKSIFNTRTRNSILHFKSVGATVIDDEMKSFVANYLNVILGSSERGHKFWDEKMKPEIQRKFGIVVEYRQFATIHRPAIFLAIQHQCGILFEDSTDYDFTSQNPIPKQKFIGFQPRSKTIVGISPFPTTHQILPQDEIMAYKLSRHFKSLGPKSKLLKSDLSSLALLEIAAHYNATFRYEEAKLYGIAALNAATGNSCMRGFACAQLLESSFYLSSNFFVAPVDAEVLKYYQDGVAAIQWHWGKDHMFLVGLHDRMVGVYLKCKCLEQALEFHKLSLDIVTRALGKNHVVTAGYMTKAGCILKELKRTNEAIQMLTESLHIYESHDTSDTTTTTLISEVHFHLAETLFEKGDLDKALLHSQRSRKLREKCYGQMDRRTVQVYQQVAQLLLAPFSEYKGVITPLIRSAYKEAIVCLEKKFRFLKSFSAGSGREPGKGKIASSGASIMSKYSTLSSSTEQNSITVSSNTPSPNNLAVGIGNGTSNRPSTFLESPQAAPIVGPLLLFPSIPIFSTPRKTALHQLTKQIVGLKLSLIESPRHKDCVRMLRGAAAAGEFASTAQDLQDVVVKLTTVSPSVYLDGILARIEEGEDEDAVKELGIVIQLTERETLGVSQ